MQKYLKYLVVVICVWCLHVGIYAQNTTKDGCVTQRELLKKAEDILVAYKKKCQEDPQNTVCGRKSSAILGYESGIKREEENLANCEKSLHKESVSTSTNENGNRGVFGTEPVEILDNIVREANTGSDPIQDTALNSVSRTQGSHPSKYRLANTFDSIRQRLGVYLDRLFYIGLSVAVILIIRNGLQLVIGKDINDVRKPLTNVVIGVFVLTGVYLIIKLITSLVALIFNL